MISGVRNAWGGSAAAPTRLRDVMDAELATKLQREEQEQWEHEIAGRFGSGSGAGWCFVEVPSAQAGGQADGGVMSVVQQEIAAGEAVGSDADFALALELEAQEAEEYARLLRQQESAMERVLAIQEIDKDVKGVADIYYTSDGQLVVADQSGDEEDESREEWFTPLSKRQRHGSASKQQSGPKQQAKAKGKRRHRHTKTPAPA